MDSSELTLGRNPRIISKPHGKEKITLRKRARGIEKTIERERAKGGRATGGKRTRDVERFLKREEKLYLEQKEIKGILESMLAHMRRMPTHMRRMLIAWLRYAWGVFKKYPGIGCRRGISSREVPRRIITPGIPHISYLGG